jgi:TPR repeat protein
MRAGEKSDARAQLRLARALARGRGIERDYIEAYIFASLAAIQGNNYASELRDELISRLRPEEIERAEQALNAKIKPLTVTRGAGES